MVQANDFRLSTSTSLHIAHRAIIRLLRTVVRQVDLPDQHLRVHILTTAIAVLILAKVKVPVLRDVVIVADADDVELLRPLVLRGKNGDALPLLVQLTLEKSAVVQPKPGEVCQKLAQRCRDWEGEYAYHHCH